MWGSKKPDTPPLADPGPKIVQANQPPKPAPASWGGTTKMNMDVMRPTGAAADRARPARIEPACERRNLRRRGSAH